MLKSLFLPFVALVGIVASANLASAHFWTSGKGIAQGPAGSVQVSLLSPCAQAMLAAQEAAPAQDLVACAQWLQGWLGSTPPETVASLLQEFGLTEYVTMTPAELNDAEVDQLVEQLGNIPEEQLAALEKEKEAMGKAVPCGTGKPTQPLACKQGRVCTTKTCTDKGGAVKNCKTIWTKIQNPLAYWFCPNAIMNSFSCQDPCPAPALPLVLGLIGGLGLFGRRRK
jgi:hypothetical protein